MRGRALSSFTGHVHVLLFPRGREWRPAEWCIDQASNAILEARLPARVEAVFRIRRSRALVRLGRADEGLADLCRAGELISDGPGPRDPWWVFWATASEISWQQDTALADWGDWGGAVPLLRSAAETRSAGHDARTVLHDQACLAEGLARVGALGDAEHVVGEMSQRPADHLGPGV